VNTSASLSVEVAEQRVLGWQTKLHRWAEEDPERRFDDLFNLLCEPATLLVAWERVKRNRGSRTAGVDGQTRERVEEVGVERMLSELRGSLRDRSYVPLPVRERVIPKRSSGKVRRLGIPALRDRVVQMAAKLVLEPIMETDFCPISYGFRPGRRTQDAIEHVRRFINAPSYYEWVIEGDVEDCFGSIHHGLLMAELRRRVTDKRVLRLVRQFLGAGIMREHGSLVATPSGAPQGAILSPLLANVALSVLDRHFEAARNACSSQERSRRRAQGHPSYRMIRYADDFVVLVHGTQAHAEAIKETAATLLRDQLRLKLSPEKTRITHVDDGFDFLGFRIVRLPRPGRTAVAFTFPTRAAVNRLKHRIKTLTGRSTTSLSLDAILHALNPVLRGWTGYYRHAASKRCFAYLDRYLWTRLVLWLRKKHPRLTWKQIRRQYTGRAWTSAEGTRPYWPTAVAVTRYKPRRRHLPWATPTPRATAPGESTASA
jgi:RNA-directed DNA polymerase